MKVFNAIVLILCLFMVEITYSQSNPTWALANTNGTTKSISIPNNGKIQKIQVKEQDHYGVIDLRIGYKIGNGNQLSWTNWACGNNDQTKIYTKDIGCCTLVGFIIYEQYNYGIIDIALKVECNNNCTKRSDYEDRIVGNYRENVISQTNFQSLREVKSIQVKEQHHYGIVNFRTGDSRRWNRQEVVKEEAPVSVDEYKNTIQYGESCGFAAGGNQLYLVNNDDRNRYTVTIRTFSQRGLDIEQYDKQYTIGAGERLSLECSVIGNYGDIKISKQVVGEVKIQ